MVSRGEKLEGKGKYITVGVKKLCSDVGFEQRCIARRKVHRRNVS